MLLVEEPPFEPQGIRLKDVCLLVGCTCLYKINPSHFPKLLGQFSSSHLSIFSNKIGINKLQLVNLTNIKFLYSSYLHFPNYLRDGMYFLKTIQFSSVTQSCLTLCDPINCSTLGLPVHHQLPEFTQT